MSFAICPRCHERAYERLATHAVTSRVNLTLIS